VTLRQDAEAKRFNAKEHAMTPTAKFEDFQKFSKQHLESVNAVAATLSKGFQEIAAESTDYSKKAFAANSAVVEKLLGAKSVETAIQIQTEFAKSAYDGFVAQATKLNELYVKMATEAFKPVEAAISSVSKPIEQ
jgi:phasin family protein